MISYLWKGLRRFEVAEHIIDNYIRDTVDMPELGSIVYCDLFLGYMEHSGVYIGNGKIAQLNGKGSIEVVSPKEFIAGGTGLSIYVGCRGKSPVGSRETAARAKKRIGGTRNYNVIIDNCHQFAASCISGEPDRQINFLWMLKHECETRLGVDNWRVWNVPSIYR